MRKFSHAEAPYEVKFRCLLIYRAMVIIASEIDQALHEHPKV
jgi:hypothetical protein